MSINIALLEAVGKGLIVQLTPYVQTDKPIRKIYLASEINDAFLYYRELPYDPNNLEQNEKVSRFAKFRADLDKFLVSPEIDSEYMKQLVPNGKGVFEIRSVRPKPSIRAFGMFIEKDVFLITNYAERKELGGFKSYAFKQEIGECRKAWRAIFPNHGAKESPDGKLSSVVTGGLDEIF